MDAHRGTYDLVTRTSLDTETPVILQVCQVSWLGWRIPMNLRALGGTRTRRLERESTGAALGVSLGQPRAAGV